MHQQFWARLLLAVLLLDFGAVARAQSLDQERGLRRDPADRLRILQPTSPALELELPALPPSSLETSGGLLQVAVKRAVLEGATVLDEKSVRTVLDPLEGRTVSAEHLVAARLALTRQYIDAGYLNSGVILPDQDASDGTLRFNAIEGRLTRIEFRGEEPRLNRSQLLRGLRALQQRPLSLADLQRELTLIDGDPRVGQINAELVPSPVLGEATLVLDISTGRLFELTFGVDNQRAPSLGGEQGRVQFRHHSMLGWSDVLTLDFTQAEGLDDWGIGYGLPLAGSPWSLEFAYGNSDAVVIEEPFDRIDIVSDSRRWSAGLVRNLVRRADTELSLGLTFENQQSESTLLGVPFSFAPGVVDGRAEINALRLRLDWSRRTAASAWALRSVLSTGLDVNDATINVDLPDGRYVAWFNQFQYLRALKADAQLLLNAELQIANGGLLPLEKYSLGGFGSVRGYRQNQIVRDNGWFASAEYRRPFDGDSWFLKGLSWAAFADVGRGWNSDGFQPASQSLESVGVGLRWQPDEHWSARLDLAHGFQDFSQPQHDLQDSGIHFALAYRWF